MQAGPHSPSDPPDDWIYPIRSSNPYNLRFQNRPNREETYNNNGTYRGQQSRPPHLRGRGHFNSLQDIFERSWTNSISIPPPTVFLGDLDPSVARQRYMGFFDTPRSQFTYPSGNTSARPIFQSHSQDSISYIPESPSMNLCNAPVQNDDQNSYEGFQRKKREIPVNDEQEYHPEPIKRGRSYTELTSEESFQEDSKSSISYTDSNTSSIKNDTEDECLLECSNNKADAKNLEKLESPLLDGCKEDEQKFLEVYIAAATKYVLVGKQRSERKAAFGVWLSEVSELNFASLLPEIRPQTLKGVLIFGSGKGINLLKEKGVNRIKINMESDFLVKNVESWTEKFMYDACKDLELSNFSNWDEYKYAIEIKQLCQSFQGMIVKWSYATTKLEGIEKAKRMARELLQ